VTLRVLHIIGNLHAGGAQVCLKQLVENSRDTGVEHVVYPLRSRRVDIPIEGTVVRLPYGHYDPRKFLHIFKLCRAYKIDVIHAHLHKGIMTALLARSFMNIPVIIHEHGAIARPGIQYSVYRWVLRRTRQNAACVVAVSRAAADQLQRIAGIDPQRIEVVYNAVDTQAFSPDPAQRAQWRSTLKAAPQTTVIGFAGRLSYEKGPDILLEAFARVLERHPDCLLVFAGDGHMKGALQHRAIELGAADKMRFLGFRKDVRDIMNAFDIGCVPSRQEAFGITAIELMSMRVPLVTSRADGLAEIVTDGHTALAPCENTPEQLARCIERLVQELPLRDELNGNAAIKVQEFSVPRLVDRIANIYKMVCAKTAANHPDT